MGLRVGATLGTVGAAVGLALGTDVGLALGLALGAPVGADGEALGDTVGDAVLHTAASGGQSAWVMQSCDLSGVYECNALSHSQNSPRPLGLCEEAGNANHVPPTEPLGPQSRGYPTPLSS